MGAERVPRFECKRRGPMRARLRDSSGERNDTNRRVGRAAAPRVARERLRANVGAILREAAVKSLAVFDGRGTGLVDGRMAAGGTGMGRERRGGCSKRCTAERREASAVLGMAACGHNLVAAADGSTHPGRR